VGVLRNAHAWTAWIREGKISRPAVDYDGQWATLIKSGGNIISKN